MCFKLNVDVILQKAKLYAMVICFSASIESKNALDHLMRTEQFRDISEAISMAFVNYHVIQRAVSDNDQIIVEPSAQTEKAHVAANHNIAEPVPPRSTPSAIVTPPMPEIFVRKTLSLEGRD